MLIVLAIYYLNNGGNKMKSWIKTIFMIYRHLPRIIDSIDKVFQARALNGGVMSGSAISYNNVYNLSENLLKLTERKNALINLKVLTDSIIKGIDKKLAKILILRYIDGFNFKMLAEHFNISERTAYRRIDEALTMASMALEGLGYDKEKIEKEYKEEAWLFDISNESDAIDYIKIDSSYLNSIIRTYKKLSYSAN